jgi:hypothetical protein
MNDIQRMGYFNFCNWRIRDDIKGMKLTNKIGWVTNRITRPIMLTELRKMFHDCVSDRFRDPGMFRDRALIDEMRTFEVDPMTSKPVAQDGCYDDRIIAAAITHAVIKDEVAGGYLDLYSTRFEDKMDKTSPIVLQGRDPSELVAALTETNFHFTDDGPFIQWDI